MARIKATANKIKNLLDGWALNGNPGGDILIYDPSVDFDAKQLQLDYFNKKELVIDIQDDIGPFKKIVFIEILIKA